MAQGGTPLTFEAECEKCGFLITVPIDRFKDKRYINWLISSLCLQYTKEGLENAIRTTSQKFEKDMKPYLQPSRACNKCDLRVTGKSEQGNPSMCPLNTCGELKQILENQTKTSIDWKSVPYKTITTSAELTAIYLPAFMMSTYKSPTEADISALLNLTENCAPFQIADLNKVRQVRESRNAIMHSGTMRIDLPERNQHLDNCINLLRDKQQLYKDDSCKEAIENIIKIYNADVRIQHLKKAEPSILDQVDQSHTLKIGELSQKLRSTECTPETTKAIIREIKEREETQAKLKLLHEEYDLGTDVIDRRKKTYNLLYDEAEQKLHTSYKNTIDQMREQLDSAKRNMRDKDAKIYELQQTNANNAICVKPLKDTHAYKDDGATLSCEFNHPNLKVTWFKDVQEVSGNNNLQIVSGVYTHQLVFSELTYSGAGKYTCTCGDVSTTATLIVQGLQLDLTRESIPACLWEGGGSTWMPEWDL